MLERSGAVKNKRIERQTQGRVLNMIRAERASLQTQADELMDTLRETAAALRVVLQEIQQPTPFSDDLKVLARKRMENAAVVLEKYEKKKA
jgi:uncharacterized protein Yka (UPF0111/DUF47 family)